MNIQRLIIALIATSLLVSHRALAADTVTYDGIKYTILTEPSDGEPGTCEVGSNSYYFSGSANIPPSISNEGKAYDVIAIGYNAFFYCTDLTSVTIPASVTSIGDDAFGHCTGLTSVTIPASVTSIGASAFSYCTGLTSITIPASVTSIGRFAFNFCTGLKSVSIPASVTSIGQAAFNYCTGLKSVTIPASVTSIGDYAFYWCTGLTSVTILASVTSIGDSAFYNCSGLTSVAIPASVTSIGKFAFYCCTGLRSVSIPASVTSIGGNAFWNCTGLNEVIIESVNAWARIKFGGETANPIYYARTFRKKDMEEPIRKLDLKGVKEISDYAFYNARNLNTIRTDAEIIGGSAFRGCSNVTDLSISADSIGPYACVEMTSLKNIHSRTTIPPIAQDNTFSNYTGVNLYVPQGTVSAYENAENCWWRFLNTCEHNFSDSDAIFEADYSTGIGNVKRNDTFNVWSANGCVYIEAPASDYVEIYSLHGAKIHGGYGSVVKATSRGVYIIRVNDSATKLLVK